MNTPDTKLPELTEAEGERFLSDLDAAISHKSAPAEHPHAAELRLALRAASELPASGARGSRASLPAASRRSSFGMWLAAAALVAFAAGCFFTLLVQRPQDDQAVVKPEDRSSVAEDPEKEKPKEKKEETPKPLPAPLPKERLEDLKALQRKVSFEFEDAPLDDALNFISSLTDLSIIREPELVASGGTSVPITLRVTDMPLHEALHWIVKLAGAAARVRDGAIYVGKPGNIREKVVLEVYDVRDLNIAPLALAESIRSHIFAVEFTDDSTSISSRDGKLIVMQGSSVHDGIRNLLSGLCAKADWSPAENAEEAAWKEEAMKQLERKVSFEFIDTPLEEGVKFLGSLATTAMVTDLPEDRRTVPVNLKMTEKPMRKALDAMTYSTGVCYTLKDYAIYITTPEILEAETLPELRVYDLSALTTVTEQAKMATKEDSLASLVCATIQPGSWDSKQGIGIAELGDKLVVRHKPKVHAQIKTLLDKLAAKQ